MDDRFLGESRNKVDGKGRVSIPVKFRRVLQNCDPRYSEGGQPRLYIVYGNRSRNYLECLSGEAFDQIDAMIRAQQPGSKLRRALGGIYYNRCDAILLDDSGRLVLSQAAREKIGLEDEAVFEGHGEKFHILKPEASEKADDDLEALIAELAQGDRYFDPLSLAFMDSAPDEA